MFSFLKGTGKEKEKIVPTSGGGKGGQHFNGPPPAGKKGMVKASYRPKKNLFSGRGKGALPPERRKEKTQPGFITEGRERSCFSSPCEGKKRKTCWTGKGSCCIQSKNMREIFLAVGEGEGGSANFDQWEGGGFGP